MGTNLLVVRPGQRGTGGVISGTQQNLTLDDAAAILKEVHGVASISPVVGGTQQVKYMNNNTRTNVSGVSATYFPIRNFEVEHGDPITDADVDRTARVAVIGPVTSDNLFGASEAVGQMVKIGGINFRVIGVLKSKGDQGYFNPDDQVLLPYSTAMKQLLGVEYLREIDVQGETNANLDEVQRGTVELLRKRHKVQPGLADDVNIRNQKELQDNFLASQQTFTILLATVAGISLLVGGIGIMNIMLVTVTERTREIGIRKAIGAKDFDILSQFMIEAVLMSSLGGLLGVIGGVVAAAIIGRMTQFQSIVQAFSIILSATFSAAVGIFFGFYPAYRASQLDPIDALRYE